MVGSALIESEGGLLLVANRRRDGRVDWTPPGGVIDEGEDVLGGLAREVEEETGLRVTAWQGPVYLLEAEAVEAGWHMQVEVHRAVTYEGELHVDDPDGIVEDARFVPIDECEAVLRSSWQLITEPMGAWLTERHTDARTYRYRVAGATRAEMTVVRL
ncbi:MAG: 8-oxo-dGTP diphosphatase [Actinomycetota bacterium]|nr:8-oxo-dGTP diphosphatase [Actinomycetota bacterium]